MHRVETKTDLNFFATECRGALGASAAALSVFEVCMFEPVDRIHVMRNFAKPELDGEGYTLPSGLPFSDRDQHFLLFYF